MVADPSGKKRDERDMRNYYDHYGEYGVFLMEAGNEIDSGIAKVYTYATLGKIRIFNTLKQFRREVQLYKYPERKLNEEDRINNKSIEKPIDRNNHLMDCARYLIQELPDDPDTLKNASYGYNYNDKNNQSHLPFALQDHDDTYESDDWETYY